MRQGYGWGDLRADALAGVVVGIVALPLSMALAVASGVPPQHGLYTAIVAGSIIALLGGSRVQISGPTAAFVVILAPIAAQFGLGGLLLATLLAGVLLVSMGIARMGQLIEFVPYPVTMGFTAGIAVVIATLQVKDLLGLRIDAMPAHYLERLRVIFTALPTFQAADLVVGAVTLTILLLWPRISHRLPAPLVALACGAALSYGFSVLFPGSVAATINSRFFYEADGARYSGIPRTLPLPAMPWSFGGPDGQPLALSFSLIRALIPSAFAIAMLGAIESLLSAVVADGMTGTKHDPDVELIGQGVGNLVAPFFGGIAATGAIARTATNVRSGARSPTAAVVHSLFVLVAVLLIGPVLGWIPMSALAALLLVVAWNMGEARHFLHLLRSAPRGDVAVLLICFGLTIVFDMVVSVTVGVVLAALLFIKHMAETTGVSAMPISHPEFKEPLPKGVVVYEIAGPLFFGAAQKAMGALRTAEHRDVRVVVLDLDGVPVIDATGVVALQSLVQRLNDSKIKVILVRVQRQPLRTLARAGWRNRKGRLRIFHSLDRGLDTARRTVAAQPSP